MQKDKLTLARDRSSYLLNKFMDSKCPKEKKQLRADLQYTWDTIRLLKLEDKIYTIP